MQKKDFKTRLNSIREFFLPLLELESKEQAEQAERDANEYELVESVLKKIDHLENVEYLKDFRAACKEIYDNERERLRTIESKAALFLSATGLIITLIISFGGAIKSNIQLGGFWYLSMVLVLISTVYFFISALYTIKALERKAYHGIGGADMVQAANNEITKYLKTLSAFYVSNRAKNNKIINSKIDAMVISQLYFLRGVITVFILSIVFAAALVAAPLAEKKGLQLDCSLKAAPNHKNIK